MYPKLGVPFGGAVSKQREGEGEGDGEGEGGRVCEGRTRRIIVKGFFS